MNLRLALGFIVCVSLCGLSGLPAEQPSSGGDWPQWRGPQRNDVSQETGLLKKWPKSGPAVVWRIDNVGVGYSSLSVKDGRIYTQGDLDGVEHVICLNAKDGSVLWQVQADPVAAVLDHRVAEEMKRLDKNHDGQIDESEALAGLGPNFNHFNKPKQGDVHAIALARAKRLINALDKDGDGKLSYLEAGNLLGDDFARIDSEDKTADAAALAKSRAEAMVKALDKNGDGKISHDEARGTLLDRHFGQIDKPAAGKNKGDDQLSVEELAAYFQKSEPGRDGLLTVEELTNYYEHTYPGRDGLLTAHELRGFFGGLRDGMGDGPRGTPTIDGDRVYSEGGLGDVSCLDAATGRTIWHVNLVSDFHGDRPGWGYSESPLIEGDMVIVTPGGRDRRGDKEPALGTLLALDKHTGKPIWRSAGVSEGAQYSSPVVADIAGVRQIVQMARNSVFGVTADHGHFLWRYTKANNGVANCATPVVEGDYVFASSAYGTGGGLVRISSTTEGQKAEQVYFEKKMANHHGGMVLVGDYLYGYGDGMLLCLNFKTGKIAWLERGGKGSLMYADGMLYCLDEGHRMSLVEATPEGYKPHGEFKLPEFGRPSWAHPVVAGGRLYIRDQHQLTAYDIRGN
jgi:outer membrane protein assembly factor BamB